ncbi:hypothetical protein NT6N_04510 [Oceaniferula spumae]|uniref:Uncharacterized protein n=1 Tax=Oceaniferula spumae TaxID=2979115 RepID=A0AAT9FHG4_9BACT
MTSYLVAIPVQSNWNKDWTNDCLLAYAVRLSAAHQVEYCVAWLLSMREV